MVIMAYTTAVINIKGTMNCPTSASGSKPAVSAPHHKKNSTCHLLPKHRASQSIDLFNFAQNSQGLLLFGRTILQNQKQYSRIWTEKQHEREIQEILLRKEKKLITRKLSRSLENLLDDPLLEAEQAAEKPWAESEVLSLLKETARYLQSAQGWVEIIKQLDKGRLFIFPKGRSEVSDLIEKVVEEHKAACRKSAAEIKLLEDENAELNTKLKRTSELLDKAKTRIEQLDLELRNAQVEIHKKAKVIRRQSMKLEEQESMHNADYAKMQEMLKVALEDRKSLVDLSKSTKESSFLKLSEKTITNPLVDQCCGTDPVESKSAPEVHGMQSVMNILRVQYLVASMLEPREVSAALRSSRAFYEAFTKNPKIAGYLLEQTTFKAKAKVNELQSTIQKLGDDDARFSFLKDKKLATEPEFVRLIDEFVCKRRAIGASLVRPLVSSRNFLYSGEMEKSDKKEGIFSGWSLTSMLGLSNQPKEPKDSEEKTLEELITAEKESNPENICATLNRVAARIGSSHPEKMSRWINQLQLCFGMLFKGSMEFYAEAKRIEKVKNFLIDKLEQLRQKLADTKNQNQDMKTALKNVREVGWKVICRCRKSCARRSRSWIHRICSSMLRKLSIRKLYPKLKKRQKRRDRRRGRQYWRANTTSSFCLRR
eukprot:TRINITY_DN10219_c0_g1_i6.p1 TRINITY_DN10219_c0_g1~~TRINITY_DN10219_c0_g1_i6.p1  ORF type:complete len:654 (-),score=145.75 TRINITY_DN10219_c0_g1_i6:288-2249(-)